MRGLLNRWDVVDFMEIDFDLAMGQFEEAVFYQFIINLFLVGYNREAEVKTLLKNSIQLYEEQLLPDELAVIKNFSEPVKKVIFADFLG